MTLKQFKVSLKDGQTLMADQLATFTHYIGGVQFRFVVTRFPGENVAQVTHRLSGMRACDVSSSAAISLGWTDAGKLALSQLIKDKGEPRVASVLRAVEAA